MSGPFGSSQWMYQSAAGFYGYEIDQSLRFNDNDSAYLNRTPSAASNQKTWTMSVWVKRGNIGIQQNIFNPYTGGDGSNESQFHFKSDDTLRIYDSGGLRGNAGTSAKFRDTGAWYHIVLRVDTTQATESNRIRIYVNGEQMALVNQGYGSTYPSQNVALGWNGTSNHYIGTYRASNHYFDGYMAEFHHVDGQSLAPTSFGETKSGIWIPKEYTGSYGTNGFHLDFGNSSALGTDVSGNSNNFSVTNLASTDQMLDSPTNSFATLNPLAKMGVSNNFNLFEGNLTATYTTNSNWQGIIGNIGVSSGKWYYEVRYDSTGEPTENRVVGWSMLQSGSAFPGGDTSVNYEPDTGIGFKGNSGVVTQGSAANKTNSGFTHSQIIGLAIDLDNRTVDIYKNNVDIGGATSIDEGTYWPCVANYKTSGVRVNFGQDSSFAGAVTAQNNSDENGIGDFYYTPPSGYLAICTSNLPDPAIDPNEDDTPEDYFNTVLYSGNNTNNTAITGVGFQPDFTWIKTRNVARDHRNMDAVRGATAGLYANLTNSEGASPLLSFDSDGFTLNNTDNYNNTGENYVSWNWYAGNSTSSNTDGSVTSTVAAVPEAGFSIVGWTATGSAHTIGHGLNQAPEALVYKNRDRGAEWAFGHIDVGFSKYMPMDKTAAASTASNVFNSTAPTSSVFSVGTYPLNNDDVIAYCFHSVDGYSKVGTYIGNGSSDGTFVYTGFRPAFVLLKRYDGTTDWIIVDNKRPGYNNTNIWLNPNTGASEGSGTFIDLVSNGFKWRYSGANNASGGDYIYMAFAEQPFKYANAR